MLLKSRIIFHTIILCLFGLTLMTVSPIFAEDSPEFVAYQYIKPAVESDGGEITLKSLVGNVVTVNLKGACSGCPSSTITLKDGIETLLKQKLHPDIEVKTDEE